MLISIKKKVSCKSVDNVYHKLYLIRKKRCITETVKIVLSVVSKVVNRNKSKNDKVAIDEC